MKTALRALKKSAKTKQLYLILIFEAFKAIVLENVCNAYYACTCTSKEITIRQLIQFY